MRPSHRLDALLLPADAHAPFPHQGWEALRARWQQRGILDSQGTPGPSANALVPGGFAHLRLDPATLERPGAPLSPIPRLYANQQGGFRVSCPTCAASIVPAFWRALEAWRARATPALPALTCPHCGATHPLDALAFAPPAAFARWAVVLASVGSAHLSDEALADAARHLGPLRVVLRRVSSALR